MPITRAVHALDVCSKGDCNDERKLFKHEATFRIVLRFQLKRRGGTYAALP